MCGGRIDVLSPKSSGFLVLLRFCDAHSGSSFRPVITENSTRVNQHPCGTPITDVVDALVSLLASTSQSKEWQSLPQPVVECMQVQGAFQPVIHQ
jgi:hypothetical protein